MPAGKRNKSSSHSFSFEANASFKKKKKTSERILYIYMGKVIMHFALLWDFVFSKLGLPLCLSLSFFLSTHSVVGVYIYIFFFLTFFSTSRRLGLVCKEQN